jgi:hypothetical protein
MFPVQVQHSFCSVINFMELGFGEDVNCLRSYRISAMIFIETF